MTTSSISARHGRLLRTLVVAVAVTATIVLSGTTGTPRSVMLASVDPIDIAQGVSLTPAPGWMLENRGPDWVALNNADGSAQMRVVVKQASGTDVVAALQADITRYTPDSRLSNVRNLSAPITTTPPSGRFQQKASIDYTADVSGRQGSIPVLGTFSELLNTSNGLSAFIVFRQNNNATPQAATDGGTMINSLL